MKNRERKSSIFLGAGYKSINAQLQSSDFRLFRFHHQMLLHTITPHKPYFSLSRKGKGKKANMHLPEKAPVLEIDNPHFTVRLFREMLKIDLKGTLKNEIEEAFENKPVLRQTIGSILGIFVPLHIHLSDIDDVFTDETGKVKIRLPRHRDITVPLRPEEAKKLVRKLNDLIPGAKRRALLRAVREQKLQKIGEEQLEIGRGSGLQPYTESMTPAFEEELAEAEEREAQKKED